MEQEQVVVPQQALEQRRRARAQRQAREQQDPLLELLLAPTRVELAQQAQRRRELKALEQVQRQALLTLARVLPLPQPFLPGTPITGAVPGLAPTTRKRLGPSVAPT